MDFAKRVTVIGDSSEYGFEEHWLVFERSIAHLVDDKQRFSNSDRLAVQIAFLVSNYDQDGRPSIIRTEESFLNVLFPTEKETYVGFLVQGPFITTPARDNVPQSEPFNIALAKETGKLVVEALCWLRDRDWLTVDVLETMPLAYKETESRYGYHRGRFDYYNFSTERNRYKDTLFAPVYESVKQAMMDEALIPAYGGGYVAAKDARLAGSADLRELLDVTQLQQLLDFDDQMRWLSEEITEDRTRDLWRYLTTILDVEEIDAEMFVRRIDDDFLSNQSDEWVRRFYEFAPTGSTMLHILRNKPIVRLEDGSHVEPFHGKEPRAYLPKGHESRYPIVKREVCDSDKASDFLKKLGLKKPDDVDEVLTLILPKYVVGQDIDEAEHQQDIELIIQALNVDSQERKRELVTALKATPFLWATNAIGDSEFRKPYDYIYFRNQTLEMYFAGNPEGWFISSKYEQYFNDLKQLDIWPGVVRSLIESDASGYVTIMNYRGRHVRGLNGFHPGFEIVGLEVALSKPNIERSRYIWNKLLIPNRHLISGEVESCTRQTFVGSETEWQISAAGRLVRQKAWLPDGNGNFVKPSELSLEDLPSEFRKDNELANALDIDISDDSPFHNLPENERRKHERVKDRTEEEVIEAFEDYDKKKAKELESNETLAPEGIPAELARVFNRPDFPSPRPRPVSSEPTDSTLEGERAKTELDLNQESHPNPLALRRKPRAKNRETERYLLDEYGGHCQICDITFKLRNGSPFFAIAHLIQRSKAELLDNPRNALCLCANHWVQFKHGELKTLDEDILHQIVASEEEQPHEILVMLCGEPQVISFSANHISKLRALVEVTENL